MTIVLDASVALSWVLDEVQAQRTKPILEALETESAVVPMLWPVEISNVLAVSERRKRLDEARIARYLARLGDLPIELDSDGMKDSFARILPLARKHRVSAYDACYLELALRLGLSLASLDDSLRAAARRVGVAITPD